jgi:hypothetical protein
MEEFNPEHKNFIKNGGSLLVEKGGKEIFRSEEKFLMPIIDCIRKHKGEMDGAMVYDKIIGSAVAKLLICSGIKGAFCLKGTKEALKMLNGSNIITELEEVIEKVLNPNKDAECMMEMRAKGKTAKEFYKLII